MSMPELAGFLCEALEAVDIPVVLSGGSCVEIYSRGEYTSYDIDLINRYNEQFKKIKRVMEALGFSEKERYFVHPDSHFFIEFPSGPLGVGDAPVEEIAELDTDAGVLRLLTPTDCIKDRLAAYYHWKDEQSLQQAVWVAQQNAFDLENVRKWSEAEGALEKFGDFEKMVTSVK
ncbi:hypothetical protein WCX72_07635 [Sulfurimonas sp. HSL1-6]